MPVSYAPEPLGFNPVSYYTLFLAGSIEMGLADNWQDKVCEQLDDVFHIYNPRRGDWDVGWDDDSPELYQQIIWEQERMLNSDVVLFYFDPKTKSPVTLLELGQCLQVEGKTLIVICPEGYWRRTNVVVTCGRYGIPILEDLAEAVNYLKVMGSNKLMRDANNLNRVSIDYQDNEMVNELRAKHEQKS